jgi:hypothetical protein
MARNFLPSLELIVVRSDAALFLSSQGRQGNRRRR